MTTDKTNSRVAITKNRRGKEGKVRGLVRRRCVDSYIGLLWTIIIVALFFVSSASSWISTGSQANVSRRSKDVSKKMPSSSQMASRLYTHLENDPEKGYPQIMPRRRLMNGVMAATTAAAVSTIVSSWAASVQNDSYDFEHRDRNFNKDALIREDYWYMVGKTPPRLLTSPIQQDDPQWNVFGSCSTQQGDGVTSNSCTYVSLKQRIPIYSKYGFSIALGAKEYTQLGKLLRDLHNRNSEISNSEISNNAAAWREAAALTMTSTQQHQAPCQDALLKMVLFASGMLTSPNYNGPNKRLLVARYYSNEVAFALQEIRRAIQEQNLDRALEAWDFGKDSWNSYFQIVNEAVSPQVGDKFEWIR